jgi:predicted glycosyltransferase
VRSVLFCNEMLGLGHLRLSLALAEELASSEPGSSALVITGSPSAGAFRPQPGVDIMKLPTMPVGSDSSWSATARQPALGLALGEAGVTALRSDLALRTVVNVRPDVVVVDYRPLGRGGELRPTLEWLREQGDCAVALGLWDVDDSPARLREQWTPELLSRVAELYDLALVYGPSAPGDLRIDALRACGIPLHHTGLVGPAPAERTTVDLGEGYLLGTGGGGVDAFELLDAVLAAIRLRPLGVPAVLITGPVMAEHEVTLLREHAAGLDARVEPFRPDMDAVIAGARAIVAMAGYCTVAEVIASGKPALLVPRTFPREEQLNRARKWARAGRVQLIEPDALEPAGLRAALETLIAREPVDPQPLTGAADAARLLSGARPAA